MGFLVRLDCKNEIVNTITGIKTRPYLCPSSRHPSPTKGLFLADSEAIG